MLLRTWRGDTSSRIQLLSSDILSYIQLFFKFVARDILVWVIWFCVVLGILILTIWIVSMILWFINFEEEEVNLLMGEVDECESEQLEVDECESEQLEVDECESEQLEVDECESEQLEVDECESEQLEVDECDSEVQEDTRNTHTMSKNMTLPNTDNNWESHIQLLYQQFVKWREKYFLEREYSHHISMISNKTQILSNNSRFKITLPWMINNVLDVDIQFKSLLEYFENKDFYSILGWFNSPQERAFESIVSLLLLKYQTYHSQYKKQQFNPYDQSSWRTYYQDQQKITNDLSYIVYGFWWPQVREILKLCNKDIKFKHANLTDCLVMIHYVCLLYYKNAYYQQLNRYKSLPTTMNQSSLCMTMVNQMYHLAHELGEKQGKEWWENLQDSLCRIILLNSWSEGLYNVLSDCQTEIKELQSLDIGSLQLLNDISSAFLYGGVDSLPLNHREVNAKVITSLLDGYLGHYGTFLDNLYDTYTKPMLVSGQFLEVEAGDAIDTQAWFYWNGVNRLDVVCSSKMGWCELFFNSYLRSKYSRFYQEYQAASSWVFFINHLYYNAGCLEENRDLVKIETQVSFAQSILYPNMRLLRMLDNLSRTAEQHDAPYPDLFYWHDRVSHAVSLLNGMVDMWVVRGDKDILLRSIKSNYCNNQVDILSMSLWRYYHQQDLFRISNSIGGEVSVKEVVFWDMECTGGNSSSMAHSVMLVDSPHIYDNVNIVQKPDDKTEIFLYEKSINHTTANNYIEILAGCFFHQRLQTSNLHNTRDLFWILLYQISIFKNSIFVRSDVDIISYFDSMLNTESGALLLSALRDQAHCFLINFKYEHYGLLERVRNEWPDRFVHIDNVVLENGELLTHRFNCITPYLYVFYWHLTPTAQSLLRQTIKDRFSHLFGTLMSNKEILKYMSSYVGNVTDESEVVVLEALTSFLKKDQNLIKINMMVSICRQLKFSWNLEELSSIWDNMEDLKDQDKEIWFDRQFQHFQNQAIGGLNGILDSNFNLILKNIVLNGIPKDGVIYSMAQGYHDKYVDAGRIQNFSMYNRDSIYFIVWYIVFTRML